ncbi:MAG: peptidoglycan-binding protein [Candidatus Pacebacteria bacterium]|nr:peptidoglycan-binding protein [Candidatus Paceibacterota bacterium]
MKKALTIFTFFFLLPISTYAISGACSYHNGVNCGAGASYTGKVQCNDGWINSSVYFSESSECNTTYIPRCYLPTKTNYNCDRYGYMRGTLEGQQAQCQAQQDASDKTYQDNYAKYKECYLEMGYNVDTQKVDFSLMNQKAEANKQALVVEESKAQADANMKCIQKYSNYNYHAEGGNCVCNIGYSDNTGKCLDNNAYYCYKNGGVNYKMTEKGECGCKEGYYMGGGGQCVAGIKPTIKLTPNIKQYVDFGNKCFNNQSFLQAELQACISYESNPKYYDVIIVDSLNTSQTSVQKLVESNSTSITENVLLGFKRNLKKGMTGEDVKQLQVVLKKLGYFSVDHVPSINFGSITQNAVIKFQKDNKIQPATGFVGPTTQAKILSLANI